MGEEYITLRQAIAITGHRDTTQLRRAAERWQAGDKRSGLRAVRMHDRLWVTKKTWVERWQEHERRDRGRPDGKRDTTPRKPRRRPAEEE